MKIFIYGTLLKGMSRAHYLQDEIFLGYGILQNTNMYDIGTFPGITLGTGTVYGEVEITNKTLKTLDVVEGYDAKNNDGLYLRKKVEVQMFNGEFVEVETYFYNYPIEDKEEIEHGDYRRFISENNNNMQWYIAYGSNLNKKRLIRRIGGYGKTYTGEMVGYRLVFNKEGSTDGEVYANAKYTGDPKDALPYVAYEVTKEQLKVLDGFEGEPVDYVRIGIPLKVDNQEVIGQIYLAHPSKLTDEKIPTEKYMRHLRKGYKYWGLVDKYNLGINEASSNPQDSEIELPF